MMAKSFCIFVTLLIFFYTNKIVSAELTSHYQAHFISSPPKIDGKLNDKAWQLAQETSSFVIHHNGNRSEVNTQAKIIYDKANIYFAFIIEDTDIVANYSQQQSPLFQQDDVIELFIDPLGQGKPYIEIGISPTNIFYSYSIIDPISETFTLESLTLLGIESATTINGTLNHSSDIDHSWQVEIKIPFTAIAEFTQQPFNQESWRFNLFRIDFSDKLPRQANEFYSWAKVGSFGFHQPDTFGWLQFMK
jgi:hypothetical protein